MKKNWIIKKAEKIDPKCDYAFLENPEILGFLDDILWNKTWLPLKKYIHKNYPIYCLQSDDDINIRSEQGNEEKLERELCFALYDEISVISGYEISCARAGWMVKTKFYLSLHKNTDTRLVFQLLGSRDFIGMPPELNICPSMAESYYSITIANRSGMAWDKGLNNLWPHLKKTVDTNIKMNDLALSGFSSAEEVKEFINTALPIYKTV